MDRLDLSEGFDVHDYRHGLKHLTQDDDSMHFENRAGFGCPACGREFGRLLVSEAPEITFDSAPNAPFCLARTSEKLLVLTHP